MSWDGIRGTLQWLLILLLLCIIAGGGAFLHLWLQKDVLLYDAVHQKLAAALPSCEVSFSSLQVQSPSQGTLNDVVIRSRSSGELLAKLPSVLIEIDDELFQRARQTVIKRAVLRSPEIYAIRDHQGAWNWSQVKFAADGQWYSPTIEIENGVLHVGLQSVENGPVHRLVNESIQLSLSPEANRRYRIRGRSILDSLGPVDLSGLFDLTTGQWNLSGSAAEVRVDEPFLQRTGLVLPEVGRRLAQLQKHPKYLARSDRDRSGAFRTVSRSNSQGDDPSSEPPVTGPSFLRADVDLTFHVGRDSATSPLDYRVSTRIENGHLSDLFLPIPLYDVRCHVDVTPSQVTIQNFQASNNDSSLFIHGAATRQGDDWSRDFVVKATHLQIDERIQSVLPMELQKVYRMIRPSGTFDLDFDISQRPGQSWSGNLRKFTARDCRAIHEYFRYPIEKIQGEVIHRDHRFVIDMHGMAGKNPISLTGYCSDGVIDRDSELIVQVDNVPIDSQFVNAFARDDQAETRKALKALRIEGVTDLHGRFVKSAATANVYKMALTADVRESTVNFVGFPYLLEGFSGRVTYNSLTDSIWRFEDLQAHHGHAHFQGDATFDRTGSPGKLILNFGAVHVPIDADLEKASLTSAPHLAPVWSDFALGGTFGVENAQVTWTVGETTLVTLRGIQWRDGTIRPNAFPYAWKDVTGVLEWDGKRLQIQSMNGWHNETYLDIHGTDPEYPTFVEVPETGPVAWEVHFGDLRIVKVNFDAELLDALPQDLAGAIRSSDLQGPVDMRMSLDMRGWASNEEVVTANWKLRTSLKENSLFAGMPIENVSGLANVIDGTWDGQTLRMEGYVDLESAEALQMEFTNVRFPFHVEGTRLVVGTPKFLQQPVEYKHPNPYLTKQVRADLYEGQVGFDAAVVFGLRPELTQYRAEINVNDVQLAQWAEANFPSQQRLNGKINGLMALSGMGPSLKAMRGNGWVNISPAAIMDLPAFAQMFALMNFRPVGESAFNYAYGDFQIHDGLFDFSRIELRGDALGLIGKGVVGFAAGDLSVINLTFDSRTNNRIPLLKPLIERFGNNWIRVQVVGTVKDPVAVIQPRIGPLDDAFREFTDAIEKGQNWRPPVRSRLPEASPDSP